MRLQPILAEAQSADQETHQIKVNHIEEYDNADQSNNRFNPRSCFKQLLWEPYLKMNASTFPFPDNVVDLPKVSCFPLRFIWNQFFVKFLIFVDCSQETRGGDLESKKCRWPFCHTSSSCQQGFRWKLKIEFYLWMYADVQHTTMEQFMGSLGNWSLLWLWLCRPGYLLQGARLHIVSFNEVYMLFQFLNIIYIVDS